jgi:NMD protein affecting ribosome stability and mRNA decay
MGKTITLICEASGCIHELQRTEEIPEHIKIMRCNWCINCESKAQDYYNEWWDEEENKKEAERIPIAPNQLSLF